MSDIMHNELYRRVLCDIRGRLLDYNTLVSNQELAAILREIADQIEEEEQEDSN